MMKMIKRLSLLSTVILSFALFSCSVFDNNTSSVSLAIPNSTARVLTANSSGEWTLEIALSGGYETTEIFTIDTIDESLSAELSGSQEFVLEDLPVDVTVSIDVNVYCDGTLKYKTKTAPTITLAAGDNAASVTLTSASGDASIILASDAFSIKAYNNGTALTSTELDYSTKYTFKLESGNSNVSVSDITSFTWSLNGTTISTDTDTSSSSVEITLNKQDVSASDSSVAIGCKYVYNGTTNYASASFSLSTSSN